MNIFNDISILQWTILILSALFIGMSKAGITGINLPAIIILAIIFDAKTSTGLVLPMLIFADFIVVFYYIKNAEWKYVLKLIPYTLLGITAAMFIGKYISNSQFNILISFVIIISILIMIYREKKKSSHIPDSWSFSMSMGLLSGFSTMMGNASGPIMAIYLLSMKLPKNSYIATTAVFFFIVNLIKLPFHIFIWKTITLNSFVIDLMMIPFIALGAVSGILIVKRINEKLYRNIILILTAISAIILIIKSILRL